MIRSRIRHLFEPMNLTQNTHFTRAQLRRLNSQFFQPGATKLFKLIECARPEEATPETMKALQDICKRFDPCQRIQHTPIRFRVTIDAEHLRFYECILLYIMYINGDPVLHIVDEAKRFGAARLLQSVSTEAVLTSLLECCAAVYTGLQHRKRTD